MDCDGKLKIHKSQGKVSNLESIASGANVEGHLGIAHTRWATHGEPNDINAHPHMSQSGMIALVHNGTIENYAVLKKVLMEHGYEFKKRNRHRSAGAAYRIYQTHLIMHSA